MRTLILYLGVASAVFFGWYSHAPLDHRMRVPVEIRQTFAALDNLAASSVHQLTSLIDRAERGPQRIEDASGPLLLGRSDGIDIVRAEDSGKSATPVERRPDMFAGLSLRGATLADARLEGFDLAFTDFRGAALINLAAQDVSGHDARFDDAFLRRTDFARARMPRARFDRAVLAGSIFDGAELTETSFAQTVLKGGSFTGATLAGARFDGARLDYTDLRQADLGASSLTGAELIGVRLQGTSLKGANVSGADLSAVAGLVQSQLDEACGDDATRLPEGMSVPPCTGAPGALARN